ncbi:hypothetical protein JQ580_33030 [Bradyrhizobium japonicum]|uniref:hypothetical protein n=1 Tax=Bradyrhizobium japonicum TaxID=375 RepID=UPI001BA8A31A|nr:hypothetical protein [Bradyrhizobium japonicum]MBR0995543.1 hypothetical protein [Bradyrhizobium japonicum]
MSEPRAPVDIETGQRIQAWLAASYDSTARVSGRYWHRLQQEQPARKAADRYSTTSSPRSSAS